MRKDLVLRARAAGRPRRSGGGSARAARNQPSENRMRGSQRKRRAKKRPAADNRNSRFMYALRRTGIHGQRSAAAGSLAGGPVSASAHCETNRQGASALLRPTTEWNEES